MEAANKKQLKRDVTNFLGQLRDELSISDVIRCETKIIHNVEMNRRFITLSLSLIRQDEEGDQHENKI